VYIIALKIKLSGVLLNDQNTVCWLMERAQSKSNVTQLSHHKLVIHF